MSIENCFGPIAQQLYTLHTEMERCIVFCPTLDDCPKLYRYFQSYLGERFTHESQWGTQKGHQMYVALDWSDMFHS